jgi:hypothetical protein
MKSKTKSLTLASLALLAQAAPTLAADVPQSPEAARLNLNAASAKAIQSSWLKVPPMCKDRSFPFAPVQIGDVA